MKSQSFQSEMLNRLNSLDKRSKQDDVDRGLRYNFVSGDINNTPNILRTTTRNVDYKDYTVDIDFKHGQKDKVLPNWVNAVVYGFITYDESLNSYCIESEQGDILAGGFLELGQRRDLAFEQFQLRGLDREVEERILKMIIEKGRPAVAEVTMNVKTQLRTYVANNAQLSPIELDRIQANDPQYQNVRSLLEEEIRYLKDIVFD
jgi:hypothetical protein